MSPTKKKAAGRATSPAAPAAPEQMHDLRDDPEIARQLDRLRAELERCVEEDEQACVAILGFDPRTFKYSSDKPPWHKGMQPAEAVSYLEGKPYNTLSEDQQRIADRIGHDLHKRGPKGDDAEVVRIGRAVDAVQRERQVSQARAFALIAESEKCSVARIRKVYHSRYAPLMKAYTRPANAPKDKHQPRLVRLMGKSKT